MRTSRHLLAHGLRLRGAQFQLGKLQFGTQDIEVGRFGRLALGELDLRLRNPIPALLEVAFRGAGDAAGAPKDDNEGVWSLDMSAPVKRDTVGKGDSFFDD